MIKMRIKSKKDFMKTIMACLLICFAFLSGCYYDTKENLYPTLDNTCTDTVNVTYTLKIIPILNSYCNTCHSGSNPEGNIKLDAYPNVKTLVDNGKLLNSITHTGTASPMPKNAGKLDDCKISAFSKWINEGALNN